eukprot:TRINITY_DN1971_c3_g1_i1.p1 TRINITY_DN1971_c3_g1~~TRINITY_DN1971_c3_g1_i1.p1  ORF type:complete len:258 (+),score=21.38 TRINITY_DN1971_c3_g1_i1:74-775(+)
MCNCDKHRGFMIASLVLVILVFISNFVILITPVYHYEREINLNAGAGIAGWTFAVTAAQQLLVGSQTVSAKNIYIGLFETVIDFDVLDDKTVDTVDLWEYLFSACDYSAMEDQTKAMQGFWVLSQISCLLLLIFLSIKVCCKQDLSHWFIFGTNIFLFVSLLIASSIIGFQYNFEFCGNLSLSDVRYDISAASFFFFVSLVLLFIAQICVCLASLCFKYEGHSSKHDPDDSSV